MPGDQKRDNDTEWEQTFGDEVDTPDRDSLNDHIDKSKEEREEQINNNNESTQDQGQTQILTKKIVTNTTICRFRVQKNNPGLIHEKEISELKKEKHKRTQVTFDATTDDEWR